MVVQPHSKWGILARMEKGQWTDALLVAFERGRDQKPWLEYCGWSGAVEG